MEDFGHILRQRRKAARLSLREIGAKVGYDYGYLSQIERGNRATSTAIVAAYDNVLEAGGALTAEYASRQAGEDMRRRTMLQAAMGALAAGPAVDRLVGLEALRHGVGAAVNAGRDEWAEIIAGYGPAYYSQPHPELMAQVGRDLTVLQHQLTAGRRPELLRAAAVLSVLVALDLVASGQAPLARRWWSTAQAAADESGDVDTRVLTRAWDVVNGCYDGRPASQVVALSGEVMPLLGSAAPSSAVCSLLSGRAQALALAGRHGEAVEAVRQVAEVTEALPDAVVADVESLWGWPEHRLRYTESWVYTHTGELRLAEAAQERALELYPASQHRLRVQVGLHRAAALIRGGHIPDGLRMAADLLDELPAGQHNALVRTVARQVAGAVPVAERRRPVYGELVERVAA